jgi:ankyrin repeat protein
MTCTMKASERGHIGVLKYLVENRGAGYGDTIRDRYGMTCTLHCAESGNLGVMKYLVEKGGGCGIRITNRYGVTCSKFARWNKELTKYIESRRWG